MDYESYKYTHIHYYYFLLFFTSLLEHSTKIKLICILLSYSTSLGVIVDWIKEQQHEVRKFNLLAKKKTSFLL